MISLHLVLEKTRGQQIIRKKKILESLIGLSYFRLRLEHNAITQLGA